MVKHCNRFANLALDYLGETRVDATEFSTYLRQRDGGSLLTHPMFGDLNLLNLILDMVYKTRHVLRKVMAEPDWDRMAFFIEYQLSLPLEESLLFAPFLDGVTKASLHGKEITGTELAERALFNPQPTPWVDWYNYSTGVRRQPGDDVPAELSLTGKTIPPPKSKNKPLPTPTHKAPSTLQ